MSGNDYYAGASIALFGAALTIADGHKSPGVFLIAGTVFLVVWSVGIWRGGAS